MFREILKYGTKIPGVKDLLYQLPAEITVRAPRARTLVLRSRQLRKETEQKELWRRLMTGTIESGTDLMATVGDIASEPVLGGLWTAGDFLTLTEAIMGREVNSRKMDRVGRAMTLAAALVPVVPSRIIIGPIRGVRESFEDMVYKKADKRGLIDESTTH